MITLNTIIYEGNFDKFLDENCWFFKFTSQLISKKMITVNNITSIEIFNEKISKLKEKFDFDIFYVSENEDIIKKIYSLDINSETIGYVYTIPYFVAIENTTTQYILNVASDCMGDIWVNDTFLLASINEITVNPICSTTMVSWTKHNYIMGNKKTVGEHEENETFRILNRNLESSNNFTYTANFTDQFFFANIGDLKKIDYNIPETYSNQFYNGPDYGGNSFEKRMVAHQIQNNVYNCISKGNQYYIHDNNYY